MQVYIYRAIYHGAFNGCLHFSLTVDLPDIVTHSSSSNDNSYEDHCTTCHTDTVTGQYSEGDKQNKTKNIDEINTGYLELQIG